MVQRYRSRQFEAVKLNLIDPDQYADQDGQLADSEAPMSTMTLERRQADNRRGGVWWAFLYGNFRPRRRLSRRAVDENDFWFDWHEPRVLYLALGIFLLSCTDALFTLNLLNAGAAEANLVMALMLETGIDGFVASKITVTGICLLMLVFAARRKFVGPFSVEHLLQSFFAGYVLLIGYEVYLFQYVFELSLSPGHLVLWPFFE
ncbi:MAG TPA: DUF5658 family protein [Gammaproteobacteria bacterium]|nr:DUF5658 family protein [Gammaproteobacteria bacterium]